jgi:hypothetical protein
MATTASKRKSRAQQSRGAMGGRRAGASRLWQFRLGHQQHRRAVDSPAVRVPTALGVIGFCGPTLALPWLSGVPVSRVLDTTDSDSTHTAAMLTQMLEMGLIPALEPEPNEPVVDFLRRAWKQAITARFVDATGWDMTGACALAFSIGETEDDGLYIYFGLITSWHTSMKEAQKRFANIHEHALASIIGHLISVHHFCPWTPNVAIQVLESWTGAEDFTAVELEKHRQAIAESLEVPTTEITDEVVIRELTGFGLVPSMIREAVPAPFHTEAPKLSVEKLVRLAKTTDDLVFKKLVELTRIAVRSGAAMLEQSNILADHRCRGDGEFGHPIIFGWYDEARGDCIVREAFQEYCEQIAQENGFWPFWAAPFDEAGLKFLAHFLEHGLPGVLAVLRVANIMDRLEDGELIVPYTSLELSSGCL